MTLPHGCAARVSQAEIAAQLDLRPRRGAHFPPRRAESSASSRASARRDPAISARTPRTRAGLGLAPSVRMGRPSPSRALLASPTRLAALLIAACSSRAEIETATPSTPGESGGRGNVEGSGSEDEGQGGAGAPHGGERDPGMGGAPDIDFAGGQTSEEPDSGQTGACEGFEFELSHSRRFVHRRGEGARGPRRGRLARRRGRRRTL